MCLISKKAKNQKKLLWRKKQKIDTKRKITNAKDKVDFHSRQGGEG
jgi:hypothetical protein